MLRYAVEASQRDQEAGENLKEIRRVIQKIRENVDGSENRFHNNQEYF